MRLQLRPWPVADTPVHICNREKPSFQRVCNFCRWDLNTNRQQVKPDRVAHNHTMKDVSQEGISLPQRADRQMAASCKDLMTSSEHRLQPNPCVFYTGNVLSVHRTMNVYVSFTKAGTDWSWEKARLILSFYRQEPGALTNWGCNSWASTAITNIWRYLKHLRGAGRCFDRTCKRHALC